MPRLGDEDTDALELHDRDWITLEEAMPDAAMVALIGDGLRAAVFDERAWIWREDQNFRVFFLATTDWWDQESQP